MLDEPRVFGVLSPTSFVGSPMLEFEVIREAFKTVCVTDWLWIMFFLCTEPESGDCAAGHGL